MKLRQKAYLVVVSTNKTSSFRLVKIKDYIKWVRDYHSKEAKLSSRDRINHIFDNASNLFIEMQELFSKDEFEFINETIKFIAIPTPELLIKDRKKVNGNDNYPTQLIVPAMNFATAFPKVGCMAIHPIVDTNKVD